MALSDTLRGFFEAEERNTRQAIAQGDLDVGFPLTLGTALDSLQQAPEYVQALWLAGKSWDDVDQEDATDVEAMWQEMFGTLLEYTALLAQHGPDTSLYDLMRED